MRFNISVQIFLSPGNISGGRFTLIWPRLLRITGTLSPSTSTLHKIAPGSSFKIVKWWNLHIPFKGWKAVFINSFQSWYFTSILCYHSLVTIRRLRLHQQHYSIFENQILMGLEAIFFNALLFIFFVRTKDNVQRSIVFKCKLKCRDTPKFYHF